VKDNTRRAFGWASLSGGVKGRGSEGEGGEELGEEHSGHGQRPALAAETRSCRRRDGFVLIRSKFMENADARIRGQGTYFLLILTSNFVFSLSLLAL